MHVNKANRGRQKRPKKATERERDGGKTPKPDGGGAGAGACERDSGLRLRLGVLKTGAAPEMEGGARRRWGRQSRGRWPGDGGCGNGRVGEGDGGERRLAGR